MTPRSRRTTDPSIVSYGWFLVRAGQAILCLNIAVLLIVFDPDAADAFVLPKTAFANGLAVALTAVLAAAIYTRATPIRWSSIHIWAAALVLAFILSVPFAVDGTVALFGVDRRFLGLTHMADVFVLFTGVSLLFRNLRERAFLFAFVIGATAVVILYALVQATGHDIVRYTASTVRPIATLGQPDTMGAFAGIAAVTALSALAIFWSRLRSLARAGLAVIGIACVATAYADGARTAELALFGGAAATVAVTGLRSEVRLRRRVVAIFAALTTLAIGAVVVSPLGSRIGLAQLAADPSTRSRLEMWGAAWRMLVTHPVTGVGPDNFAAAYPLMRSEMSVQIDGIDVLQNSVHNWVLYLVTSGGVLAATALVGLMIAAAMAAWHLARVGDPAAFAAAPLGAYLGQSLVTVTDPALDWIAWVSLGILAGGTARTLPRLRDIEGPIRPLAAGLLVVCIIALPFVAFSAKDRIAASEATGRAAALMNAHKPLDAVQPAREAIAADSRRAGNWAVFGSALADAGNPSAAELAYLDAAHREPWLPTWWRDIALQRLARGDGAGSVAALRSALNADPHDVTALDLLARLNLNAGDSASAASYGERALAIFPLRIQLYDAPVIARERLGDWAGAEKDLAIAFAQSFSGDDETHLRLLRARLFVASGRAAQAQPDLAWLLANAPEDPDVQALKLQLEGPHP